MKFFVIFNGSKWIITTKQPYFYNDPRWDHHFPTFRQAAKEKRDLQYIYHQLGII